MTAITESITDLRGTFRRRFNWRFFYEDNLGTWYQKIGVFLLALITAFYAVGQFRELPISTLIILIAWLVAILMVAAGELLHRHTGISRWLKNNLLNSVSNTLLTLLIVLLIISAINGIWNWGVVNATFDPFNTYPEDRPEDGATWGVLAYPRGEEGDVGYRPGGMKLLTTGRMPPEDLWRVWLSLGFMLALWLVTYLSGRPRFKEQLKTVRRVTNILWVLSPFLLYVFLAGLPEGDYSAQTAIIGAGAFLAAYALLWWQKVIAYRPQYLVITAILWPLLYTIWWGIGQSGAFPPINVDNWGGFMLTIIIASSVILLSLPLGMVLALARRSEVYGIPAWIIWPIAIGATIWGFTTTPDLLATSRNIFEQITSFWPVLILAVAYLIQRMFKGNIVAGASTTFIELIRSVPLITLLFMGINMAPFFLASGADTPAKPWPVIIAYTLFSSAYMAETIRGGLQAIPHGQYEAADALGFNTLQKMRFIILPQALRVVIPAIVGQFIGAYKSSSLVAIVGLFEFLGSARLVLSNERWFGLRLEVYVFVAVIYFLGSSIMSAYSRRLETRLGVGER